MIHMNTMKKKLNMMVSDKINQMIMLPFVVEKKSDEEEEFGGFSLSIFEDSVSYEDR